ncbi:MAG TPA: sigma-70 family RNA polymerase sigma factor [Thermoanaerobaculia bacterium]|jgi:RNA polymerase sigma factor (sigma-70 family)
MTAEPASERLIAAGNAALNACRAGDDAGGHFDAIYATYTPILRRIAIRKWGIPSKDADDLVQDVFASYLAQRAAVRDVHAYLIGAICNASRYYRRRDEASPFSPRPEHRECGSTPDDELLDGVIRTLVIRTTLARLGPSCREALEQFYLYGETAGAIAERRQTTPNYICRLLNYCRNRARSIYARMSTGDPER